jgi:hypothetical protein
MFHARFDGVFVKYLYIKLFLPTSNISLVFAIKEKISRDRHVVALHSTKERPQQKLHISGSCTSMILAWYSMTSGTITDGKEFKKV